jgi:hypothetical protein
MVVGMFSRVLTESRDALSDCWESKERLLILPLVLEMCWESKDMLLKFDEEPSPPEESNDMLLAFAEVSAFKQSKDKLFGFTPAICEESNERLLTLAVESGALFCESKERLLMFIAPGPSKDMLLTFTELGP